MKEQRDKKWIGAAIGLVSQGIGLVTNLISKNKQAKAEEKARQEQLALEAKQKAEEEARQRNQALNAQFSNTSYIDEFQKRIEFKDGGSTTKKSNNNKTTILDEIKTGIIGDYINIPTISGINGKRTNVKLIPNKDNEFIKNKYNDLKQNTVDFYSKDLRNREKLLKKNIKSARKIVENEKEKYKDYEQYFNDRENSKTKDILNEQLQNINDIPIYGYEGDDKLSGFASKDFIGINDELTDDEAKSTTIHEITHSANAIPQKIVIQDRINKDKRFRVAGVDKYLDNPDEIYSRYKELRKELEDKFPNYQIYPASEIRKQLKNYNVQDKKIFDRYNDDFIDFLLNDVAKNDNVNNTLNNDIFNVSFAKNGGKIKHKIEAENGEIIKSDKPIIIRNGGIAIPLGNGYNLLKGKTHEQGGIDIDLKGDGRVWSDVPFLNGESPARKILKGENPNKVFIQQEMFKKVNNLEDDGSKKKQMGDYVTKNKRKNKINDLIYYATKGYDTELADNVNTAIGDYDNTTTGRLINYVENSDSLGYKDGKWYSPKVTHPRAKVDNNNFGMGVDKKQNPYIKGKIKKDSKGRQYITEDNEKEARYKSMRDAKESAEQRYDYARKITKSDNELSNIKKAITESSIYNLGSGYVAKNLFNDKTLMDALMNGTDEEYNDQVNKYYKKKERNDRINKTNEFLNLKRMGCKMKNNSLIYNLNGNIKNKNGFVPSTGKRQKAEGGIKLGVGDWMNIGNGILNVAGGLTSYFMNRKALKDMENTGIGSGPEVPVAMQAAKLNTNYNINPELSAIRETEANTFKDIDQNTTSSNVALARKQQARLNSLQNRNALYAEKENRETELINADRLNQQQVSAQNNQAYNQYLKDKYNHQLTEHEFKLGLIDKRGENNIALIQNLTSAVGNVGNYFTQKESDDKYYDLLNKNNKNNEDNNVINELPKLDTSIDKLKFNPIDIKLPNTIKGLDYKATYNNAYNQLARYSNKVATPNILFKHGGIIKNKR